MCIKKDDCNHKYEQLETVGAIFVVYPLLDLQRQGPELELPGMGIPTLLNSVTGLQEIVNFITIKKDLEMNFLKKNSCVDED